MKITILTNIPSPYRVDFFYYLQTSYPEHEIHIIYSAVGLSDRSWSINKTKLINSHFLNSVTLTIPRKMDAKHVHLPLNLRKILSSLAPDILICMEYNPTILSAVRWAKQSHVPYISWTDGTLFSERKINKLQRKSRHYIINGASAYIASSTRSKETQIAYGANPQKVFLSSLSVDISKHLFKRTTYNNTELLYVGSLSERKGIDLLFYALTHVKASYHLTLVGDGELKQELIHLCQQLNLSAQITFAGFQEGITLLENYHSHDIFILPTREDCFGLVILEAMCASMPVVCSKFADGAHDLIEDGKSGLIIDPYQAQAFGQAIDSLLTNPDKIKCMGEAAYNKALHYDFDTVSKGFWEAISYISSKRS